MSAVESSMQMELGSDAPFFTLPSTNGFGEIALANYRDKRGFLVAFICNHCPYVKHIADKFAMLSNEWQKKGIAVFAINSNDYVSYPEDSPEAMAKEAKIRGFEFPYLLDERQEVAKLFEATCTPDFFLLDSSSKLFYRGQFDKSRPSNGIEVTGADLKNAVDAILKEVSPPKNQFPSLGCNIKWK